LARAESELIESIPNRSATVVHLRPGPRLHSRAARAQRRSHGPVPPLRRSRSDRPRQFCHKGSDGQFDTVMGYFDGNTVTALWNYAQHFALADNSFATMSGQSTRGALNLTAGDTFGVLCGPSDSVFGDVPECGPPVS